GSLSRGEEGSLCFGERGHFQLAKGAFLIWPDRVIFMCFIQFMHRNYQFNVQISRLAYLTGRSLSAFKRDFKQVFNNTPNRWLVQRRLQEAYFLMDKKNKKPSEIYLELGFETLPHFSYAFKKRFGMAPTELAAQKRNAAT
ncbi:helix-turn-helix domain-containing protein, partial [Mucilaginibacter sp. 22184]|uniref:helix-turn-helix domain-containing protein n=1 Tax=Mucilaginibacter sp. 22184 TaxID=3453887 RepID=UPI003F833357